MPQIMNPNSGKAILITGAGARLGQYLAAGLAKDEWAVALHYNRSEDGAQTQANDINAHGDKAVIVQANLNVPAERDTLISRAAKALGQPLTALINNASTFTPDSIGEMTDALFDHHMNANLRAPLHLIRDFAAQFPKGDGQGSIINMVDQRVLKPNPEFLTYTLAKSGLRWATTTLAQDLAPHIRVNAIGPGPTLQNTRQSELDFAKERSNSLLGTGSPPDTILQAARYLLNATSVTGQMIAVDGGQHLTWKTADMVGENGDV